MGNAIFTKDASANWNRVRNVRWHDTTQFNRADAVFWDQLWGLIGTATYTNRDSGSNLLHPQIAVEGTKIYYAWLEVMFWDALHASWQLWTASMNTDGTGWTAVQRTIELEHGEDLEYMNMISVPGDKLYFVWNSSLAGAREQLWTGSLTFDLVTWNATQRTADALTYYYYPRLCSDGTNVYYVWMQSNNLATWVLGTGKLVIATDTFTKTTQATTEIIYWPQIAVNDGVLYYCYISIDTIPPATDSFWTATMNIDGTGFAESERLYSTTMATKINPYIGINDNTVYYMFHNSGQILVMNKYVIGGDFSYTYYASPNAVVYVQFQVFQNWIYFIGAIGSSYLYLSLCNKDDTERIYETNQGIISLYNALYVTDDYVYTVNMYVGAWDIYTGKVSSEITPIYKWNRVNI